MQNYAENTIKDMRLKGMTYPEIAGKLKISRASVMYHLDGKSVQRKNREKIERARELLANGASIKEGAKAVGSPESSLYNWFSSDPDIERARSVAKVCKVCGAEFFTCRQTKKYCSDTCCKKANKTTSNHRRRAKEGRQMVDKDITLKAVFWRDRGICHICGGQCSFDDFAIQEGKKIVGEKYPTIDHIVPLCGGGLHSWENVKLAHKNCNERKSAVDRRMVLDDGQKSVED